MRDRVRSAFDGVGLRPSSGILGKCEFFFVLAGGLRSAGRLAAGPPVASPRLGLPLLYLFSFGFAFLYFIFSPFFFPLLLPPFPLTHPPAPPHLESPSLLFVTTTPPPHLPPPVRPSGQPQKKKRLQSSHRVTIITPSSSRGMGGSLDEPRRLRIERRYLRLVPQ